jgi:hypothetical protein
MGLTSIDLCVLGYLLVILHGILESIGLGFLAFIVAGLTAYALIAIRLKYRRRIIRDFFASVFLPRVVHDPEASASKIA